MAERLGALGGIGKEDFQVLSEGLKASNNPITNVFGYEVTPEKALTTAIGYSAPIVSGPLAIGGMISDYNINQLANQSLNRPTDFMSGFNTQSLKDLMIVCSIGLPPIFNIGFGVFLVSGLKRIPFPPAIITTLFNFILLFNSSSIIYISVTFPLLSIMGIW